MLRPAAVVKRYTFLIGSQQDICFFLANVPNAGEKTYILHKASVYILNFVIVEENL